MYISRFILGGEGVIEGLVMSTGSSEQSKSSAGAAIVYAAQNVDRRYQRATEDDDVPDADVMKVGLVNNRTEVALVFGGVLAREAVAAQIEDRLGSVPVRYIPEDASQVKAAVVGRGELPTKREACLGVLDDLAIALNHRLDVQQRAA